MSLHLLAAATTEFSSKIEIEDNFNLKQGDEERPFRCYECERSFTSKRNLVDHCRGHHQGAKPHACPFEGCGKSFLRPAHLLIHTRIHTGEKPFVCNFPGCGKRWNQKSALKQHMRSHTGEKPYACTSKGCDKKFSTSSSCKRHIASHESPGSHNPSSPSFDSHGDYDSPRPKKKRCHSPTSGNASSGDEAPPSPASSPPPTPVNVAHYLNSFSSPPLSPSSAISVVSVSINIPEAIYCDTFKLSRKRPLDSKMTMDFLLN